MLFIVLEHLFSVTLFYLNARRIIQLTSHVKRTISQVLFSGRSG